MSIMAPASVEETPKFKLSDFKTVKQSHKSIPFPKHKSKSETRTSESVSVNGEPVTHDMISLRGFAVFGWWRIVVGGLGLFALGLGA